MEAWVTFWTDLFLASFSLLLDPPRLMVAIDPEAMD